LSNPYDALEQRAFWRPAVGALNPLEIEGLWQPRLKLQQSDKVVTAGSCFAQHIGRALTRVGFNWFDAEPGPGPADLNRKFNYGVFSFRTGNIYTVALLRQWIEWALGVKPESNEIWEKDGRFYDPFRPNIEPGGFASADEVRAARKVTLNAIRMAVAETKVLVFTLGLTEAWVNAASADIYPMCPGTVAGAFDGSVHVFRNYKYGEIYEDLSLVAAHLRDCNPTIQILLTVSPVPLTATASGNHVLVATTYSKAVLRAAAGDICDSLPYIDYFPSFEIITAPVFRGMFYLPNAREVSLKGVDFVMTHFFSGLKLVPCLEQRERSTSVPSMRESGTCPDTVVQDELACEEAMLEAFAKK
jgi:hypothetical protein